MAAPGGEDEVLRELLAAQRSWLESDPATGSVRCRLSGHTMPARAGVVSQYLRRAPLPHCGSQCPKLPRREICVLLLACMQRQTLPQAASARRRAAVAEAGVCISAAGRPMLVLCTMPDWRTVGCASFRRRQYEPHIVPSKYSRRAACASGQQAR